MKIYRYSEYLLLLYLLNIYFIAIPVICGGCMRGLGLQGCSSNPAVKYLSFLVNLSLVVN